MYTPYYSGAYNGPFDNYGSRYIQNPAPVAAGSSPIWVQGEAAARAYMVAAGSTVLLMDSEKPIFYLKTTDASGMPQPLRIFEYTEKNGDDPKKAPADAEEYATKKDLMKIKAKVDIIMNRLDDASAEGEENNGVDL